MVGGEDLDNKTLAILVRSWANRLERELDILTDGLRDGCERHPSERQYIGPSALLLGPTEAQKADPENWQEVPGDVILLDGLTQLVAELRQAVSDLLGDQLTT